MSNLGHSADKLSEFVGDIQAGLRAGYGFVPLLGAGISAESGVPLIPEVRAYLAKCIARALGVYSDPDERLKRRWYPKTDSWPDYRNLRGEDDSEAYNLLASHLKSLREDDNWNAEIPVFQKALGDLADWRSALLFLASLHRENSETDRPLRLGPPDYDVVDAFFRHSTSGRQATLPHQMLALLAQPMRIDLLLTTNFDELLENAFHAAEVPLDPVEVHLHAKIPSYRHIRRRRSLVKLHGGRYGLRADYSLDQEPSSDELHSFNSYFYHENETGDLSSNARNHLLVLGMSAEDRRVMEFITSAFQHGKPKDQGDPIKVFWLCYSVHDEEKVRRKLSASLKDAEEGKDWFVLQYPFTGLLLLQLWQLLTHTLPPRFAVFPISTRICTPPLFLTSGRLDKLDRRIVAGLDKTGKLIAEYVGAHFYGDKRLENRLLRLTADPGHNGSISKGAHHYYRGMRAGRKCVWLSLEYTSSTDEFFEHLTDAISRAAGITDWLPIVLFDQNEKALGEINRLTKGKNEWVIFLDVRDGAGSSLDTGVVTERTPNGWLDWQDQSPNRVEDGEELNDGSASAQEFVTLLCKLTSVA